MQKRIPRGLCEATHVPNREKLVMARMLVWGGFPQDRGGILIAKTFKYFKLHGFEEKLNININIY